MIRERNGIKELEIFWTFKIDKNLPKYKKDIKFNKTDNGNPDNTISFNSEIWGNTDEFIVDSIDNKINKSILHKIIMWFYNKFIKTNKNAEDNKRRNQQTILEFFTSLATNFKQLTPIGELGKYYEHALEQAKETGQVSLQQKIENIIDVVRTETHLIQSKLSSYITEEQVINFYESTDSDKNLKLTWVKNFVKVIPSDIVILKSELDKKELFDNYVVLHYDPNNDATDITKEEKEIKKDPILFGLLKNSRKLYYIADWKDEYCDLTLENMFVKLEEEILTINNKTVKNYLNNGGSYTPKRKYKNKNN